jgi:hypothetical protein
MSASDSVSRKTTRALPRVSIAGLLLAFALAATAATVVGIEAWSLGGSSLSGPSKNASAAAYQEGLHDGLARAHHRIVRVRATAYTAGRKKGYRKGFKDGLARGRRVGQSDGRTAGYRLGYAAGLAANAGRTTAAGH